MLHSDSSHTACILLEYNTAWKISFCYQFPTLLESDLKWPVNHEMPLSKTDLLDKNAKVTFHLCTSSHYQYLLFLLLNSIMRVRLDVTVVLVIVATQVKKRKADRSIKICAFLVCCGQTTALFWPICAVYPDMQIAIGLVPFRLRSALSKDPCSYILHVYCS